MKHSYFIILLFSFFGILHNVFAQKYVFAQLTGAPVNTTGWDLANSALVNGSEIILTPNVNDKLGSVFFKQPINLSQCITWAVEFDFKIYGGNSADGFAFCFLDAPPTGFKSGSSLGIPPTSNGLKICFDTYLNCLDGNSTEIPKIEMRWGVGYDECWAQPTSLNINGNLDFLRSSTTNHAKIEYNNGNIKVYVNNSLYLTGFQLFNFTGYFGFTASTGGLNDIHAISNAIIYTNIPPSFAGKDSAVCSGSSIQIGTINDPTYSYSWEPPTGLNNSKISNPIATLINNTSSPLLQPYIVTTSLASSPACNSKDTVLIIVNLIPTVSVNSANICKGSTTLINATPSGPYSYSWSVPALAIIPGNTANFNTSVAGNYKVIIKDTLSNCISKSSSGIVRVFPSPSNILAPDTAICKGENITLKTTKYFNTYLWNTASVSPSIIVDQPGLYWLKVVDIHGCSTTDSIRVGAKKCVKGFYMPNAFTPDNNGLNDMFKPLFFGKIGSCQFSIYNRWGNEVFKSNDYKWGWDGKLKGVKQASGIYLWVCTFQFEGENTRLEKGSLVLIDK